MPAALSNLNDSFSFCEASTVVVLGSSVSITPSTTKKHTLFDTKPFFSTPFSTLENSSHKHFSLAEAVEVVLDSGEYPICSIEDGIGLPVSCRRPFTVGVAEYHGVIPSKSCLQDTFSAPDPVGRSTADVLVAIALAPCALKSDPSTLYFI